MFGVSTGALSDPMAVASWNENWPYFLLAAFFSTPLLSRMLGGVKQGRLYHIAKALIYMGLLTLAVSYLAMGVHNPFIYFNF